MQKGLAGCDHLRSSHYCVQKELDGIEGLAPGAYGNHGVAMKTLQLSIKLASWTTYIAVISAFGGRGGDRSLAAPPRVAAALTPVQ